MRKVKRFKKISQGHPELDEWQSWGSSLPQPHLRKALPLSPRLHDGEPAAQPSGALPLPRLQHEHSQCQVPRDSEQEAYLEEATVFLLVVAQSQDLNEINLVQTLAPLSVPHPFPAIPLENSVSEWDGGCNGQADSLCT